MKVVIWRGASARASLKRAPSPQADGRDWRQADSLAHHEDLFNLRAERLHHLLRIQGIHHQGVVRQAADALVSAGLLADFERSKLDDLLQDSRQLN